MKWKCGSGKQEKGGRYMSAEEDCLRCEMKYCEGDCFNKHPGSRIALGKQVNYMNDKKETKVHVAGDYDDS